MQINSIFQNRINTFKLNKNNSNPIKNINFQGKDTFVRGLSAGLVPLAAIGTLGANGDSFVLIAAASEVQPTAQTTGFSALSLSDKKLSENNNFQLAQSLDAPSLTFDFTSNFKPRENAPIGTSIVLTTTPNKDYIEEFRTLDDVLTQICEIDENDIEQRKNKAIEIIQTNPWMLEYIKQEAIDYSNGNVSNVDPEILLNTDFAAEFGEAKRIVIPTSYVTAERRNDYDTTLIGALTLIPTRADKNGFVTIELRDSDLKNYWKQDDKIAAIEKRLADEYGISTMQSYAGIGIWHSIATDKNNYQIFEGYSEQDAQKALLNYIEDNKFASITLPRVNISVMADEENQDMSMDILTQKTDLGAIISYLAPDRAVWDVSDEINHTIRPIDVLEAFHFTNGDSFKEAYEQDPDKYEGFVLAAWRQQIENNDALIKYYGDDALTFEDLYEEIDLDTIGSESKINLQRVAFAHPDCAYTCEAPKVDAPKTQVPTEPTRPTRPNETTETTEPSKPTKPSKPTQPTETTECPDLPEIPDVDDETLPTVSPTLPTRPTETTCPTEGSQPTSGYDDGDAGDVTVGFGETQPAATQHCPTEASQPTSDYNNGNTGDVTITFNTSAQPKTDTSKVNNNNETNILNTPPASNNDLKQQSSQTVNTPSASQEPPAKTSTSTSQAESADYSDIEIGF